MTLKEIKIGGLFMFVGDTVLTDIYKKKRELNNEYCIVGLPNVYDEFAARGDSQVVTYDTDTADTKGKITKQGATQDLRGPGL